MTASLDLQTATSLPCSVIYYYAFIFPFQNLYKELLARSDELNQLSRQLTGYRTEPELTSLCETLEPRVSHLQESFSELENSLKDRLKSLQVREQKRRFSLLHIFHIFITYMITSLRYFYIGRNKKITNGI